MGRVSFNKYFSFFFVLSVEVLILTKPHTKVTIPMIIPLLSLPPLMMANEQVP